MCPRVDVNPAATTEVREQGAVDDAELEAELVAHLLLPLHLDRGRANDQNAAGAVAQDEFLHDKTRLDGFAEADVVGDEQIDPRHRQRADDRIELVVVHFHAAAEGGLKRLIVGTGDRAPRHRIEEGRCGFAAGRLCPPCLPTDSRVCLPVF